MRQVVAQGEIIMSKVKEFRVFLYDFLFNDWMDLEVLKPTNENIEEIVKEINSWYPDEEIPEVTNEEALKEILSFIKESREEFEEDEGDSWRREQAMEAGMLHGINAYNDVMGFAVEDEDCTSCGGYGCHWCL